MKKFILLAMLIGLGFSGVLVAQAPEFVVTSDGIQYFNKLRMTVTGHLVGKNDAGLARYHKDEVLSFRLKGKIYDRIPLYKDKQPTGKYAFMELCGYRNGLKVYQYKCFDGIGDEINYALVYKNEVYWLSVNKDNAENLSSFFGIQFRLV